jgi:hypothetical protein
VVEAFPRVAPFVPVVRLVLAKVKLLPVDDRLSSAPPMRLLSASRAVTVIVVPIEPAAN